MVLEYAVDDETEMILGVGVDVPIDAKDIDLDIVDLDDTDGTNGLDIDVEIVGDEEVVALATLGEEYEAEDVVFKGLVECVPEELIVEGKLRYSLG